MGAVRLIASLAQWLTAPRSVFFGRWIFLRILAICFLCGFLGAYFQVLGLVGSRGLSPLALRWTWLAAVIAPKNIDSLLIAHSVIGVLFSFLALVNVVPKVALACCTALWFSFLCELGPFDVYQPDSMLVTAGFCAVLIAPGAVSPGLARGCPPNRLQLLGSDLLICGIYWGSAVGKMQNPLWRSFIALDHYFESAPVPAWTGWFVQNYASLGMLHSVCASVLVLELAMPLLLFLGWFGRRVFCVLNLALQLGIALTASHSFLNLMMLGLGALSWSDRLSTAEATSGALAPRSALRGLSNAAMAFYAGASLLAIGSRLVPVSLNPLHFRAPTRGVGHLINSYGLYEDVGRAGYRIEVQGSIDGQNWHSYTYRCLSFGDAVAPSLVWPYQCRLDWLMWRASKLGVVIEAPWLRRLFESLTEGSPQVEALFRDAGEYPKPNRLRLLLRELQFSTPSERQTSGIWWRSRLLQSFDVTPTPQIYAR